MLNVKAHIEQAINNIQAEYEREIAGIRDTIMRDKVLPQNVELDAKRDRALQELQAKLNADITALQEAFTNEQQAIIAATEQQKNDTANALIGVETASITKQAEEAIAELRKLLEV